MSLFPAAQRGFSLLEVLVTLVVVSIGLMGAVALQVSSLRASDAALQRTRATLLAEGMIERIQANATSQALALYNVGENETPPLGTGRWPHIACSAACDSSAWAGRDLWDLDQQLQRRIDGSVADALPLAGSCIAIDGSQVSVSVVWQGSGGGDLAVTSCGSATIPSGRREVRLMSSVLPQ
ncbi:type IV pilus modification protein PilV [Larsenimonas rhizosphaerae]|uniref:Type IV pilus modification protein PilV n=1 Tax=Larsenimonas rhizosphaerae TaxID=2944682 RepID=A0AA42CVB5_9GAMM|nr:type IV pilus modification protein PilV [Larsenimonas rhizosphaerae]MCM2132213.1 type IV pilus modification protein PilV [Larsenimonas rhizosphaerae]MCX2525472.1 type IV pilus modification protein PilV [Larsenimonas rhizosphaerae]